MSDDGEIPFLDADPLANHQGKVGAITPSLEDERDPDERAISLIARKLEKRSSQKLSHEEIEDMAIELYNRSCRLAQRSKEHLKQLALLLEEDPDMLQKRLLQQKEEEDSVNEGGASALLRALSGD